MHKWWPKMYSFVYVLMRLTSLALKQPFFCILVHANEASAAKLAHNKRIFFWCH